MLQEDHALTRHAANFIPLTPVSLLERTAEVHPERTAIRYGSQTLTYREFSSRCRLLASALNRRGIIRGDVVSILAPNTPAHLEAHFGVPMAGAVLNSINTRLDASTIAYVLQHGTSRLLLVDDELLAVAREAVARLEVPIPIIRIADDAVPKHEGEEVEYESLLASGASNFAAIKVIDEWESISLNYTSGTTGNPKGVLYHHRGAYLNAIGNTLAWGLTGHPVYLWTLPLFHCNGWCFPWTITALAGTHVCIRRVDSDSIAAALVEEDVTHFCGAPVVLARATEPPEGLRANIPNGVKVMVAGAPPAATLIARAESMGFVITQTYGLTEVYGPCVVSEWKTAWEHLPHEERAGLKARQGVRYHLQGPVEVLDPETLLPVPADGEATGEIMIRGNIAMKGYLGDAAATSAAFAGGWFRSGDLAVRYPDGYIQITDRSKDIIISGGENISSIEIESAIYQHPAVAEVAVVGKPDETWGEVPCAFVTLKPGQPADQSSIIEHCRATLARFKVPKAVVFQELPKTATGKVQKYLLRDQARSITK
jgi:fatty-acyl-CoA synthase